MASSAYVVVTSRRWLESVERVNALQTRFIIWLFLVFLPVSVPPVCVVGSIRWREGFQHSLNACFSLRLLPTLREVLFQESGRLLLAWQ
mgnify:CR=1 FL=1